MEPVLYLWGKRPPDLPVQERLEWPGLSPNYTSKYVPYAEPWYPPKPLSGKTRRDLRLEYGERNNAIIAERRAGSTYSAIGKKYGLSTSSIQVVCKRYGLYDDLGLYYWGA